MHAKGEGSDQSSRQEVCPSAITSTVLSYGLLSRCDGSNGLANDYRFGKHVMPPSSLLCWEHFIPVAKSGLVNWLLLCVFRRHTATILPQYQNHSCDSKEEGESVIPQDHSFKAAEIT